MGIFDSLWNGIKSTAKWIGKKLGLISEDIGHSEAINENSNTLSIEQMNKLLCSYSTEYNKIAKKTEDNCLDIVNKYFEYLLGEIQKNHDIQQLIGIKKLEKTQKDISNQIKGTIIKTVASKLSLDDKECRKILSLPPCDNKTFKMKNYCSDILDKANNDLADKVTQVLREQSYEINNFLDYYMTEKENSISGLKNAFSDLEKQIQNDGFEAEKLQLRSKLKINLLNDIYSKVA